MPPRGVPPRGRGMPQRGRGMMGPRGQRPPMMAQSQQVGAIDW